MSTKIVQLSCDQEKNCTKPITHIDSSGWVYCTPHGIRRNSVKSCRKLQNWELRWLKEGNPIPTYSIIPEPTKV